MSGILMRDVSHAGHELGRADLEGLPAVVTLRELLRARVHADVERYNAAPGLVFTGLVQPADSVRHSDGHRLAAPRLLDADLLAAAAEEGVTVGILWFVVAGERVADLDHQIDVEDHDEVLAVMRRSIVAADS